MWSVSVEVVAPILAKLVRREDLSADEASRYLSLILAGDATDAQVAGFAVALRAKGETAEEMAALVRTMLEFAVRVPAPEAWHERGLLDTCGTGGDRAGTVNVSTMAAFVVAGAGVPVAKHGNRAASSASGSADVLEALGVTLDLGPDGVVRCIDEAGIGFCFAPRFHPALRFAGPARRELGVPTTFNFLGPLANPAGVRRQVVGVSDPTMAERVVEVLSASGARRAWVCHGDDGLDELTTVTSSRVIEIDGGVVRRFVIDPSDYRLARATREQLRGGDAARNAEVALAVLAGQPGPARDIVVLNAAAALVVAGVCTDMGEGLARASRAIDDGAARGALEALVDVSAREAKRSQG